MATHIFTSESKIVWTYGNVLDADLAQCVKFAHPEISGRVQEFGTYLTYKLSYSQFCGQVSQFPLAQQEGC